MTNAKVKVESGIQLLARLTRKPEIENFYPVLFENGPKHNEVIEVISDGSHSLLTDIISEALIPSKFGGKEAGVIIFNTDGNFNFEVLVKFLRKKWLSNVAAKSSEYTASELNDFLHETLCNLYLLEIYDATQFYTTIHNLESILMEHSNISLVIFDTLTAFYWSEQGFKITKMDVYLKNLLHKVQKITREYKVLILYTRPEYFSSSKVEIESLEVCCEHPTMERLNYTIQTVQNRDASYQVIVRTFNNIQKKIFNTFDDEIKWL